MLITGVRHVKVWVTDLAASRRWYEEVLGVRLRMTFEDDDGVVRGFGFEVPGAGFELALRQDARLARALDDADPFALATTRAALDDWVRHLDRLGVEHSPVIRASRGYALGFRDPDRVQIRLYADDPEVAAETGDRVQVPGR